jgi:SSS family solute:Na+ symporter
VIFTRDLYHKFFNPKASDAMMLVWSKRTTIVIGVGGIVAALSLPDVFELLIYTYTLWAPSIIPPMVVALLWGGPTKRRIAPRAGASAIVAGIAITFLWGPRVLGEPFGIPSVLAGIIANLLVLIVVHRATVRREAYRPEETDET